MRNNKSIQTKDRKKNQKGSINIEQSTKATNDSITQSRIKMIQLSPPKLHSISHYITHQCSYNK